MNKGDVANVKEDFDKFYNEYLKFIREINVNNLNIEKIDDMYNQAEGFANYYNNSTNSVDDDTKKKISSVLQDVRHWKNEAEARGIHISEAETTSAPAPMESGGQPILKKVENPGLNEIKKIIAYTETGVLDENGKPRQTEKHDGFMDERKQFLIDFSRGIGAYLIGQKSRKDLPSNFGDLKEEEKKEAVANIVKEFLGMGKDEKPDSDKSKLYKFIINSGQEMTTMFTDDMYHNIQYQGVQTSLRGTPQFEMKWGIDEKGECILELNLNIRVMTKGQGMDAPGIACNQNGQVELFELGEEPKESPPLVRYHYKARLVPTENGAKLETISYSVELHPGLSHRGNQDEFKLMKSAINAFNNQDTGTNDRKSLDEKIQQLRAAIDDVKKDQRYKFVKDFHTGSKEERKAVAMIDKLDKMLKSAEKSTSIISSSIFQKVVLAQIKRMNDSDDFSNGMTRLEQKKAKPDNKVDLDVMFDRICKNVHHYSTTNNGHLNLKSIVNDIKNTEEYRMYKSGAYGFDRLEHLKPAFKAIDACEKLLNRAMKTEKIPIAWEITNSQLKVFLEKNRDVFKSAASAAKEIQSRVTEARDVTATQSSKH